jgi:hypothetical protein
MPVVVGARSENRTLAGLVTASYTRSTNPARTFRRPAGTGRGVRGRSEARGRAIARSLVRATEWP